MSIVFKPNQDIANDDEEISARELKCLKVAVTVKGVNEATHALIDSGREVSCISEQYLNAKEGVAKDATKITKKRQMGCNLFRNDITSKSVENLVLNGDLDKSSLQSDLGNDSHLLDSVPQLVPQWVPQIVARFISTHHESTGLTLYELHFDQKPPDTFANLIKRKPPKEMV